MSESLAKVSLGAQLMFFKLLPLPDDHGCFDARPAVIRGKLFPLELARISEKQIGTWLSELHSVDCIRLWLHVDGIQYGVFPKWERHQVIRSLHNRKTPSPPESLLADSKGDGTCNQPHAHARLNPNPNPNLNLNHDLNLEIRSLSSTEDKKRGKHAKQDRERGTGPSGGTTGGTDGRAHLKMRPVRLGA